MASDPILRDRRMLQLPLPRMLFLTAREFILTWSPVVCRMLPVLHTRHDHVDRTKRSHVLTRALYIFFGRVDITQCEAERFGHQICNVLLALDSLQSHPLGPAIVTRMSHQKAAINQLLFGGECVSTGFIS